MLKDLIKKNRSYRRFHQDISIEKATLEQLIDLARISASAGNKQPLKYFISCDPEKNARIFPSLAWAAYLKDWNGPVEGERPTAYIGVLGDTTISTSCDIDAGIACQNILLAATEMGLGGCILLSFNRTALRQILNIPEQYKMMLMIALGKPKEAVVLEAMQDGDVKYWRDEGQVHHVPKRSLQEIILDF
jgi:nitroreductase